MLIGQRREYFSFLILLCEEGKITRSRLVHKLPCKLIQLRSCFSVPMASRFEIVDEEYIEELKDKSGERTFSKNERMKGTCKQI